MRIDLHTHSNVSDGTDTPAELVVAARDAGLDVVALTDHDTFDGLDRAVAAGREHGVEVVRGLELSCSRQGQSVHLLAYGADPEAATLAEEMVRVREGRTNRLRPCSTSWPPSASRSPRRQVMAQVGTSARRSGGRTSPTPWSPPGWVADRTEAFDRFLADGGPAHVGRYAIEVEHGIDLVHAAGGVAVIAHPWGRGRAQLLPADYLTALVEQHGLDGIEVDHQDHDAEARAGLRALADRLGVLGTGSSDYHGTGKTDHGLGVNTTRPEVYDELRKRMGVAV